jgi:hypothetical protein
MTRPDYPSVPNIIFIDLHIGDQHRRRNTDANDRATLFDVLVVEPLPGFMDRGSKTFGCGVKHLPVNQNGLYTAKYPDAAPSTMRIHIMV